MCIVLLSAMLVNAALLLNGCTRGESAGSSASKPSAASIAPSPPETTTPAAEQLPNILLYVVDTLRADSLGCYGHPTVETPVIDQLAREGVLFETALAPCSWTRASMASLLTGLVPRVHGAEGRDDLLAPQLELLSERLKAAGYTTACITANPNIGSFFGFDQGFDAFEELYSRAEAGEVKTRELVTPSDRITGRAMQWLDSVERPFFLLILAIDPHSPYAPPAEYDRYGGDYAGEADGSRGWINREDLNEEDQQRMRSLYWGEIAFNDHSFGELLDHLRERGSYDDTITVFTSDHGEEFWEHGQRGHGKALYEESVRIPMIVRAPQRVPSGQRVSRVVELVDIFPTLLAFAGQPIPDGLDGRSLFASGADEDRSTFLSLNHDGNHLVAWRDAEWKLLWNLGTDERHMYDLSQDPSESAPGSAESDRAAEMFAALTARMQHNAQRFAELHEGRKAPRIAPDELPDDVLESLRALGYVGD